MNDSTRFAFKRATDAPALPNTSVRFIIHCMAGFRGWFLLMLILETGQAMSNILVPYAIGQIIDGVTEASGDSIPLTERLKTPLMLFAALNIAEILFSRASGACLIMVGPRLRKRTTQILYAYLQHHSVRYFSGHFAGALAHRITETAMSVNHTAWAILFDFWPVGVVFAVSVALLLRTHDNLGWFVAAWVLVYVGVSFWLAKRCRPYAQAYAETRSQVNGKIVDSVTNILNVKLFARLRHERDYLDRYLETEVKAGRRTFWYMERVRWFQFISAAALKVGTIYFALRLWDQGLIGVGDFAMSAGLALLIIGDARNLSRRFLEFFEYVGNVGNGVTTIVRPHPMTSSIRQRHNHCE